jgi:hypothetical protein
MQSRFLQYSEKLDNTRFVQWVDPPAIHPYQEYINYLEDRAGPKVRSSLARSNSLVSGSARLGSLVNL